MVPELEQWERLRRGSDLRSRNKWCGLHHAFWERTERAGHAPWCVCYWGAGVWHCGEAFFLLPFSSDALRDGKEIKWPDAMYPDLHMPFAPSWSLHWAYRDGHLVNLPVSLLVEGDIIALRPGQESFASLRGIKVAWDFLLPWECHGSSHRQWREGPRA